MDQLTISPHIWDEMQTYFDHPVERMTFLAARKSDPVVAGEQTWSVCDVMFLDDATDYAAQGQGWMELADDIRPRTLQWATAHGAALVEAHSHGPLWSPTTFSALDIRGLLEGVPQLLWRLHGRPYGAIVLGGGNDVDTLAWADRAVGPNLIERLLVGSETLTPSGIAMRQLGQLMNIQPARGTRPTQTDRRRGAHESPL